MSHCESNKCLNSAAVAIEKNSNAGSISPAKRHQLEDAYRGLGELRYELEVLRHTHDVNTRQMHSMSNSVVNEITVSFYYIWFQQDNKTRF